MNIRFILSIFKLSLRYSTAILAVFVTTVLSQMAQAKTVRYELTVRNEKVNMSGKKEVDFALTVNGSIPAPTLEFTEGDDAEILVKNEIPNEEVSIHWHGILLPPEEDGVAYVNTPPIFSGQSRLFKFKIRQTGTYWYHSHTAVQEQKGVYGAFIVHPKNKAFHYDKDAVVVLSDWSDENADQIIRNLRKDGDYYLYKKDSIRSYVGAYQAGGLRSHLSNEWIRMGGMDLSDVGYDAFLINGRRDSQLLVAHPGEKIRIRIINAGASSYFYVSMGIPMQVIAADGVDIEPVMTNELLMGMAETYDILFTSPEHKNYELRATVQDVTGYASTWIGMGKKVPAPNKPLPDMYAAMDHGAHGGEHGATHGAHGGAHDSQGGAHGTHGAAHGAHSDHANASGAHNQHADTKSMHADHSQHMGRSMPSHEMDHSQHTEHAEHANHGSTQKNRPDKTSSKISSKKFSAENIDWSNQSDAMLRQNSAARDFSNQSTIIPTLTVDDLKAIGPTTLPKNAKVHDVKFTLGGDMERYIWHLNGKAIQQDRLLMINSGEIVRFTFVNETMMHHPMHFHGHFFRVINQHGERSPLKHTVDVPPHGTRTIEFYANEPGQWMLHCHNLYHMKTGMARVVRYNDYQLTPDMKKHDKHDPHLHEHIYSHTELEVASNHAKVHQRIIRTWDEITFHAETADIEGDHFSTGNEWETEGDLFYRRWFTNFFHLFGGGSLYHEKGYGAFGFGYVLPMLIESSFSVNHEGDIRIDIEKRFQWTKYIFSDADFTWRPDWGGDRDSEYEISLMYSPSWSWAAGLMWTEKSVGVGAQFQF